MKKTLCLFICLIFICISAAPLTAYADDEIKVTLDPQNYTYCEGSVAVYTVRATGSNLKFTWFLRYSGKLFDLTNGAGTSQPWESFAGSEYGQKDSAFESTYHFSGILEGLNGSKIYCHIENGSYQTNTKEAYVSVSGTTVPPMIEVPSEVSAKQNEKLMLECTLIGVSESDCTFQWYESGSTDIQQIKAVMDRPSTSRTFEPDTGKTGTRYYFCRASLNAGGSAYSNAIVVTVEKADEKPVDVKITTKTLPDAKAGEAYTSKIECSDPGAEFSIYFNPGKSNEFDKTGLTLGTDGTLSGTPVEEGAFSFWVQADGDNGTDYVQLTLTVKAADATTPSVSHTVTGAVLPTETKEGGATSSPAVSDTVTSSSESASQTEIESGTKSSQSLSESGSGTGTETTDQNGNKPHFTTGASSGGSSGKMPSWVWILIVIIVVLVAVNIVLIVKKKQ